MDLSKLNRAQREAVTTTEGYVRVIAGAACRGTSSASPSPTRPPTRCASGSTT